MQIPKWKKLWSYINPIELESTSSEFNKVLEVILVNGRKQLTTEDAIYSFDDKYLNFKHTFDKLNWNKIRGKNVLVLGLGLGSVIMMLEKIYKQNFDYTAIEIDPEICRLCNLYTLKDLKSKVDIISTDAMNFFNVNERQFDIIIMDIFQNAKIPYKFQSKEFFETLKSTLSTEGLLMFNTMNITDEDKEDYKEIYNNFQQSFPNPYHLKIKKNIVLLNDKSYLREL